MVSVFFVYTLMRRMTPGADLVKSAGLLRYKERVVSKEKKCPKCKSVMEYRATYVFGDSNLGVQSDWLECPKCSHKDIAR